MPDPEGTFEHFLACSSTFQNKWFSVTFVREVSHEKLVENFKNGLPEPKIDFWAPKPHNQPTAS
jgi:hypothetical protein